ncbi:MAG: hypothetical protein Q9195_005064 [Heterodermia aff. obscurata]
MSHPERLLSLVLATIIGVGSGVYIFKPDLQKVQREKDESQIAEPDTPSDTTPKPAAEAGSPGAATEKNSGKGT